MLASYKKSLHAAFVVAFLFGTRSSCGRAVRRNSTVSGTVLDPTGAVVAERYGRNS